MRSSTFVLLGATALCLSACGGRQDSNAAATDTVGNLATAETTVALSPAQVFANNAASSDAFEIASSRLALEKSNSANVRNFAQQMVTAHTESTSKLNAAAASGSPAIVPDPALTPAQRARLDTLRAADGAAFDTAYVAEQRTAHETTLAALRDYSASGDVPSLRTFATELVPVVTAHLNMANALRP